MLDRSEDFAGFGSAVLSEADPSAATSFTQGFGDPVSLNLEHAIRS
jgi:hypothetical protein